jgi:hypothetical protein
VVADLQKLRDSFDKMGLLRGQEKKCFAGALLEGGTRKNALTVPPYQGVALSARAGMTSY